jgi:hypothetical protein
MATAEGDDTDPTAGPREEGDLAELRRVLFGPEQQRLARLQERLDDPQIQAEEVARVLPDAIRLRSDRDGRLTDALIPLLEKGLHISVRKNPEPLVDVLFPVIGPAIRKAVAEGIRSMVQTINQALEHAFSPRALRWRWEAARTGRPYAEIVLKHTLTYHAEQAFLIHRDSGLLLLHVADAAAVVRDEEMVGGMLTAIRTFVGDSFAVEGEESLQSLQVGELTVWVEQSPYMILALVIRGTPPESLKGRMSRVLEAVHELHAERLRSFDGDASAFAPAADLLRGCMSSAGPKPAARPGRPRLVRAAAGTGVAGLLIWWAVASARSARREEAWAACVERLGREPGIVVLQAGTRDGRRLVRLLRDPLAADPAAVIAETQVRPRRGDRRGAAVPLPGTRPSRRSADDPEENRAARGVRRRQDLAGLPVRPAPLSEEYLSTVGVKVDKKPVRVGGTDVNLVIWDIAGQDDLNAVRLNYLRGASGYLLVADGTRPRAWRPPWRSREGVPGVRPVALRAGPEQGRPRRPVGRRRAGARPAPGRCLRRPAHQRQDRRGGGAGVFPAGRAPARRPARPRREGRSPMTTL